VLIFDSDTTTPELSVGESTLQQNLQQSVSFSDSAATGIFEFEPPLPGRQTAYWANPRELRIIFTQTDSADDEAM